MPNDTITVRVISDESELFRWIVERMEETGPSIIIPKDFSSACDVFLRDLQSGDIITSPVITKRQVKRAIAIGELEIFDNSARKNCIIEFLAEVGESLSEDIWEQHHTQDALIMFAIITHPEIREHIKVIVNEEKYNISSSLEAMTRYGIFFNLDIIVEECWKNYLGL